MKVRVYIGSGVNFVLIQCGVLAPCMFPGIIWDGLLDCPIVGRIKWEFPTVTLVYTTLLCRVVVFWSDLAGPVSGKFLIEKWAIHTKGGRTPWQGAVLLVKAWACLPRCPT